jgi:hypothetical protein
MSVRVGVSDYVTGDPSQESIDTRGVTISSSYIICGYES